MNTALLTLCAALLGSVAGIVPGLHVLNLFAILAVLWSPEVPPESAIAISGALLGSWALASSLPTCLLSTPDESAFFAVLPAQHLLARGRAGEAIGLCARGCQLGMASLLLLLVPTVQQSLAGIHQLLRPHLYWLLWAIIIYLIQSEWPRPQLSGERPAKALRRAWRQISAGLAVFTAAGMLGCIVFLASPLPPTAAAHGLMPIFIGLFAMPWLLTNLCRHTPIPDQDLSSRAHLPPTELARGAAAGIIGGSLATSLPGVTGGVGGWIAGQILGTHAPHVWLLAQSTTRTIYYVAGCALLFLPEINTPRGGAAWMLYSRIPITPPPPYALPLFLGACGIGMATSSLLLAPLARLLLHWLQAVRPERIALCCILLLTLLSGLLTSWTGLLLLTTATGIGLLPQALGCKRMHLLAVILLPIAITMSGLAPAISQLLRLP